MLPRVLREDQVRVFKFWYGEAMQDGTHYCNELFYRAMVVDLEQRPRLYHLACRLSGRGATTLVTLTDCQCSLWISLRNQSVTIDLLQAFVSSLVNPTPWPFTGGAAGVGSG